MDVWQESKRQRWLPALLTCPRARRLPPQCMFKAIEICKPGTPYREIGEVITKHAKAHG